MLIVACPNQDIYSTTVGVLRDIGVQMGPSTRVRRLFIPVISPCKWVVFPTDYYASARGKDGGASKEEIFAGKLTELGIPVFHPEPDREYSPQDDDGGIGVLTPVTV